MKDYVPVRSWSLNLMTGDKVQDEEVSTYTSDNIKIGDIVSLIVTDTHISFNLHQDGNEKILGEAF